MSVSILEALQNANHNLGNVKRMGLGFLQMVENQLNNAVTLLEKGYDLQEQVEPLLEQYGDVESVPERTEHENTI